MSELGSVQSAVGTEALYCFVLVLLKIGSISPKVRKETYIIYAKKSLFK